MAAPTTPSEGADLLLRLRLAIAKARSNCLEVSGRELAQLLAPELLSGSMLNEALRRLEDKTPTWQTLNNVLTLARRAPLVTVSYALRWDEDLPESYSFPWYEGGDS